MRLFYVILGTLWAMAAVYCCQTPDLTILGAVMVGLPTSIASVAVGEWFS